MDKPIAIPYFVLAGAFWGIMGGLFQLLRLLESR
jgi:hypothetical protein